MSLPEHVSDQEKADALTDLVGQFREEWWTVDESGYTVIDGGADLSSETARVLRLMLKEVRG